MEQERGLPMRSLDRIKPFLKRLEKLWLQNPDLRFAQIAEIVKHKLGTDDIFYVEDEKVIEVLKVMIDEDKQQKFNERKARQKKVEDRVNKISEFITR